MLKAGCSRLESLTGVCFGPGDAVPTQLVTSVTSKFPTLQDQGQGQPWALLSKEAQQMPSPLKQGLQKKPSTWTGNLRIISRRSGSCKAESPPPLPLGAAYPLAGPRTVKITKIESRQLKAASSHWHTEPQQSLPLEPPR